MSSKASVVILCILCLSSTAIAGPAKGKGEVIRIRGKQPKPPRAKNHSAIKAPPYSDRAINQNAWTRAWMLLDVDARGRVVRLKFMKRPGYDLEQIATEEAFKLRFDPARNQAGKAVRSSVIWPIEWPAYWWLIKALGTATRMPPIVHHGNGPDSIGAPRSLAESVPCRGEGPMELGSVSPMYRDCSVPDLDMNFDSEPWITRR